MERVVLVLLGTSIQSWSQFPAPGSALPRSYRYSKPLSEESNPDMTCQDSANSPTAAPAVAVKVVGGKNAEVIACIAGMAGEEYAYGVAVVRVAIVHE